MTAVSTLVNSRWRTQHVVDLTGVLCLCGYAVLAFLAQQIGEPELMTFYGIVLWTALPVFALFYILTSRNEALPIGRLFFWAIAFRVCGLLGGPIYEDDFFRYLWDGYRFFQDGTPYGTTPESFFLDAAIPLAFQDILGQINHPDLPTIYGPITQLAFLLSYLLKGGSIIALQSILVAIDLLLVFLLTRLTDTRNVLLYAWCPLVIKEIAFTAHPEGIGICLVIAAVLLTGKKLFTWSAICLALAVGAKVFALALVPFVLKRAKLKHWLVFLGTLCLLYLPFVLHGETEFDSLITFAREWEFNASLFAVISTVLSPTQTKLILAILGIAIWLWWFAKFDPRQTKVPRGDHVYGLFLLVVPVINPWYVLWILPFATIYLSRWAWTASIAVLLAYTTGLNLGNLEMQAYAIPWWVTVLEFSAVAIALAWDVKLAQRRSEDTR